jgi:hypothetical protein
MRAFLIASVAAMALATAAVAETRPGLRGFDSVNAEDNLNVEITLGPQYAVSVTGSDAARVRTEVRDDTLRIRRTNRPWFGGNPPMDATVRVVMPRLVSLAASRGAEVEAQDITAEDIELAAAMGGSIEISGTCVSLDAAAAMGGSLDARNFHCANADVSAAMGGSAEVFASTFYDAAASQGASIEISGDGRGDVSTAMGGSVSRH